MPAVPPEFRGKLPRIMFSLWQAGCPPRGGRRKPGRPGHPSLLSSQEHFSRSPHHQRVSTPEQLYRLVVGELPWEAEPQDPFTVGERRPSWRKLSRTVFLAVIEHELLAFHRTPVMDYYFKVLTLAVWERHYFDALRALRDPQKGLVRAIRRASQAYKAAIEADERADVIDDLLEFRDVLRTPEHTPAHERLEVVNEKGYFVAVLDGVKRVQLGGKQEAEFLQLLIDAAKDGHPIVKADFIERTLEVRPSRVFARLPQEIQQLVHKPGRGGSGYSLV